MPIGDNSALISKVKTAYLYNIAKFVSWPDDAREVVLCLDDKSPLYPFAKELANKPVANDRRLVIANRLASHCHIVFDDQPPEQETALSYKAGSWRPITLAISDQKSAQHEKYAIQFFVDENGRLQFSINMDAITDAEYRISSKLLRLARNNRLD